MPLSLLALLFACDGSKGEDSGSAALTEAPTWSEDVGPIYARTCASCHAPGGAGPFDLTGYEEAKAWAVASSLSVQARTMPPFLVRGDGTCGDYVDNQWLSEEEIATIAAWAEGGAPEGSPGATFEAAPLAVLPADAVPYLTPDFTPEVVGGEYAENDEYRCFDVGTVDQDTFLVGYSVEPGNAAMVHHVLMMPVDPDSAASGGRTAQEQMELLDAQDEREGWPCFVGAGTGVPTMSTPVAWAPGQGAVLFPDGSGVKIGAGDRLIAQVHYNLVDTSLRGEADQTQINLLLSEEVEQEAFIALPDGFLETLGAFNEAAIPPGESAWTYTWDAPSYELLYYYGGSTEGLTGASIWGVLPHMHQYGTKMNVSLNGECIADVPQWDFGWQRVYFYEEGLPLDGSETLEVSCTYNTEGESEEITPGWGTYNEMCLSSLYVVLHRD